MSIEGIEAALASPVTSPTQKAVMVVLGYHADDDRISAPPIATIVAGTAFSARAVQGALRSLEVAGMIVRRARTGYRGETLPAVYCLAFAEPKQRTHPTVHREMRA